MNSRILTVFLMSDLYVKGTTEDGEPVMHNAVSVVVENERGARWAHSHVFMGHERGAEGARIEATRMLANVVKAMAEGRFRQPEFNPHWNVIQPAYGSQAYAGEWRKYAAEADLAEGNFEYNSEREWELREAAGS
jgi:hypothetical protein